MLLRVGCGFSSLGNTSYNQKQRPSCKKVLEHLINYDRELRQLHRTNANEGRRLLDGMYEEIDEKNKESI